MTIDSIRKLQQRLTDNMRGVVARAAALRWVRHSGTGKDLEYLTQNLGLLLSAGVDVVSALESVEEGMHSPLMKHAVQDMRKQLIEGKPLSVIFTESGLFSERVSTLVHIGEESGQLAKYFKMIGDQEEKQRAFRAKIRAALMYPLIVFSVTIVVGIGVSWFILPRLARVFLQLKLQLPFITRVILGFGTFLSKYGIIVIPLFLAVVAIIGYFVFVYPKTKFIGERILFSVPGLRLIIQEVELARMGFIFGSLLQSGVPIMDSLRSMQDATQSSHYKSLYSHVAHHVEEGMSLEESFSTHKRVHMLVPLPVQQLIATGSKTGTLTDVLLKIGIVYEEKSEISSRNLSVILEPALLFVVWIAVVAVALAVILPIYNLIGGINHH
jgi:type II secretory pathway component PulF